MLQTMVLFSSALRSPSMGAKLQALEGWVQLLVALAAHAPSHLKTVANQVLQFPTVDGDVTVVAML